MLAASVDSASRVLADPTPERSKTLVDRIVESKIEQGQLDETPLTFSELTKIKEEFVIGLSGIYHQRIDYPAPREDDPRSEERRVGKSVGIGGRRMSKRREKKRDTLSTTQQQE